MATTETTINTGDVVNVADVVNVPSTGSGVSGNRAMGNSSNSGLQALLTETLRDLVKTAANADVHRLTEIELSLRGFAPEARPELGVILFTEIVNRCRQRYGPGSLQNSVQLVIWRATGGTERVVILGKAAVQRYCANGDINEALAAGGTVTVENKRSWTSYRRRLEDEYPLRLRIAEEQTNLEAGGAGGASSTNGGKSEKIPAWASDKSTPKQFRYRQRYSFTNLPDLAGVRYDCSVYREGSGITFATARNRETQADGGEGAPVPLLKSRERYDVEMDYSGGLDKGGGVEGVVPLLMRGIRLFLEPYYKSPFYLSRSERQRVLQEYAQLTKTSTDRFLFVGPDVVTGRLNNFLTQTVNSQGKNTTTGATAGAGTAANEPEEEEELVRGQAKTTGAGSGTGAAAAVKSGSSVMNFDDYLLTHKADGLRYLVFTDANGQLYLLDGAGEIVKTDYRLTIPGEAEGETRPFEHCLFDAEILNRRAAEKVGEGEGGPGTEGGVQVGVREGLFAPDQWRIMLFDAVFLLGELVANRPLTDLSENINPESPPRLSTLESFMRVVIDPLLATLTAVPFFRMETKPYYSGNGRLDLCRSWEEFLHDHTHLDYPKDGVILTNYRLPYVLRGKRPAAGAAAAAGGAGGTGAGGAGGAEAEVEAGFSYKIKNFEQLTVDFLVRRERKITTPDPNGLKGDQIQWEFGCYVNDKRIPILFKPFYENNSWLLHPDRCTVRAEGVNNPMTVRGHDDGFLLYDNFVYECAYDPVANTWRPLRHRAVKTFGQRPNAWSTANDNWDLLLNLSDPEIREIELSEDNLLRYLGQYLKAAATERVSAGSSSAGGVKTFGEWFKNIRFPPRYYSTAYEQRYLHEGKHQLSELDPLKRMHRKVTGVLYARAATALAVEKIYSLRLLELACGQAGDIFKWALPSNHIATVVGVDIDSGQISSAQSRYRSGQSEEVGRGGRRQWQKIPYSFKADFVVADITRPLQTGEAGLTVAAQADLVRLVGTPGTFDLVMCQYAIHFALRSEETARTFLNNVSYSLKKGGYFMGTSFDGARVYAALQSALGGRLEAKNKSGELLWSIERRYEANAALADYGQLIDVFVSGLNLENLPLPEALVNFEYLRRLGREYGLALQVTTSFTALYEQWESGHLLAPWGSLEKLQKDINLLNKDPRTAAFSGYNSIFSFQLLGAQAWESPGEVSATTVTTSGSGTAAGPGMVLSTPMLTSALAEASSGGVAASPSLHIWSGADLPLFDLDANRQISRDFIVKIIDYLNEERKGSGRATFKYKEKQSLKENLYEIYRQSFGRSKWGNVKRSLEIYANKYRGVLTLMERPEGVASYLDYGAGDGYTAWAFTQFLKAKETIAIDLEDIRKVEYAVPGEKFFLNRRAEDLRQNIPEGSVDAITFLQVLHHVVFEDMKTAPVAQRLQRCLQDVTATVRSGGQLLLREHDVRSPADLTPVLIEHLVYEAIELEHEESTAWDYQQFSAWVDSYHQHHQGWYFSQSDLIAVLESLGWRIEKINMNPGNRNVARVYNLLAGKIA